MDLASGTTTGAMSGSTQNFSGSKTFNSNVHLVDTVIFDTFYDGSGTSSDPITMDYYRGINKIPDGTSTLTVTNAKVAATDTVLAVIITNTGPYLKSVVPGAGTFTINTSAAGDGTKVSWVVLK